MFRTSTIQRLLPRYPQRSRFLPTRPVQQSLSTTALRPARKDTQDKDSLEPRASEYSKSGDDDAAAANPDAAFNPNKTRPEEAEGTAGEGGDGNPLDVSPGNPEVSKPRGGQEGGAQNSPKEKSGSGSGSPTKSGGSGSG